MCSTLNPWHFSGLSVMYFEIKLGMCFDHVSSQAGHKELWQLLGEAQGWFVATLLSGIVGIINNKLPKHNEVVNDNRKSIMHENTPMIYWYLRHPHTASFKDYLKTISKDQERIMDKTLWWGIKALNKSIHGLIITQMPWFPWEGKLMETGQLIYSIAFLIAPTFFFFKYCFS